MALKIVTWNIEHSGRLIDGLSGPVQQRKARVRDTLGTINPDILCMVEGPKGENNIIRFSEEVFDGAWVPVILSSAGEPIGSRDKEYATKGTQWIWFLVREEIRDQCTLQSPAVWQELTKRKDWKVHWWGKEKPEKHSHYRHPQVLHYCRDAGTTLELIGIHLKSKVINNQVNVQWDSDGNLVGPYRDEALANRVKLATEARDIRDYLSAKFAREEHPGILILGDCNDGPGQDYFEYNYLFFDLVSNLEGDVVMAEHYFNHALFDYPPNLRWTAKYDDEILKKKAKDNPLLLDHIMMSQPLCQGLHSLKVNAHAGKVEHDAYDEGNAKSTDKTRSSDHRPVSVTLDEN